MAQEAHLQQYQPNPHFTQIRVASGLNFLAGILILVLAWIGAVNVGNRLNGIIGGAVIAILAASRYSGGTSQWASWLNVLIGIWFVISPWVYGFTRTSWLWSAIVLGIIVIVLGVWSALASTSGHTERVA